MHWQPTTVASLTSLNGPHIGRLARLALADRVVDGPSFRPAMLRTTREISQSFCVQFHPPSGYLISQFEKRFGRRSDPRTQHGSCDIHVDCRNATVIQLRLSALRGMIISTRPSARKGDNMAFQYFIGTMLTNEPFWANRCLRVATVLRTL